MHHVFYFFVVFSFESISARMRQPFDDVRDRIPHNTHRPAVSLIDKTQEVDDAQVFANVTLRVGDRVVNIQARVAEHLISKEYEEIYLYSNGTVVKKKLSPQQRRFSDLD